MPKKRSLMTENTTTYTQSNPLICAAYKLSLTAKRVLCLMMSKVDPLSLEEGDQVTVSVTAQEFMDTFKVDNAFVRIRKGVKELWDGKYSIRLEGNDYDDFRWLSRASHRPRSGLIEVAFTPETTKELRVILIAHTRIPLQDIGRLTSIYSTRLFEMLYRFYDTGFYIVRVDELQRMMQVNYARYNHFKTRVLTPSLGEICDKTPLDVEVDEVKDRRKVVALKFFIKVPKGRVPPKHPLEN